MQRHRFYAPPSQIEGSCITLDADEAHHLVRVLRLSEGDCVFAFDGQGSEWECEIARVGRREVELNLLRQITDSVESPLHLTLAQALIKGDRFDLIVQKSTELGVARIVPLITDHSEIRRVEERAERVLQRWRRIALEALKQCGRRKLVEIVEPIHFADFCRNNTGKVNLMLSERGGLSLREVGASLAAASRLNLGVGPEGGWSDGELKMAEDHGLVPLHLGSRVVRAETAAIASVTILQHLFGDIK
jgi:16S rRNA (uracil1498-N3)-methyltransferase